MRRAGLAIVLLAAATGPAHAHKPSDSYLTLEVDGARVNGRWDIALRDLEHAIGLDGSGDGAITWGELRARHGAIAEYALARLALTADGKRCANQAGEQRVGERSDGAYTVLSFRAVCPAAPRALGVEYGLLFDVDPQHRGLVRLDGTTLVVRRDAPRASLTIAEPPGAGAQLAAFVKEGVRHIWIGIDHILFLLALLIPSVLARDQNRWRAAARFRPVVKDVAKVVTAFTVAHSITLVLSVAGWVELPSRLVETAIAVSVVLAALNNVFPVVDGRWTVAFALGLLHGFGFSSVLVDLGLPQGSAAVALVGFNVGVELGQLAIVAVFLPLAFALRRSWAYRRLTLIGGSLAIAALALFWSFERLTS